MTETFAPSLSGVIWKICGPVVVVEPEDEN